MPKISVITPTVRPEGLPMISKCLKRQDFTEWEWVIAAPGSLYEAIGDKFLASCAFVPEPPKRKGDFYRLCGAWNAAFGISKGELLVSCQDWMWFDPTTLTRLWDHYLANSKALIGMIGHQYERVENNKPEGMMWQDPRARTDLGTFYEVAPTEIEFSMCSIPKQAIIDCGGIDEDYDKGAAVGEKEMCWRLDKLGYKFYLDQTLEYRALHHPRLTKDWDEKYKIASDMYIKHLNQLSKGERPLNVDSLRGYNKHV